MALPLNPYVAGNPVGDSLAFIGRADVLREVLRVLRAAGQRYVLFGQRRIGKTSFCNTWRRGSRRKAIQAVYFDLQDKADWPWPRPEGTGRTVAYALGQMTDWAMILKLAFRDGWLPCCAGRSARRLLAGAAL